MGNNRSLTVIIPNYFGEELLAKFMPSVEKALANYPGLHETIIVDDASTDGSWDFLRLWEKREEGRLAIRNAKNLGFSGTCNVGLAASQYDILFFLNNDVELAPDFFSHFSKYFDCEKTFALAVAGFNYEDRQPLDGVKRLRLHRGMTRVTENMFPDADVDGHWYETFAVQGSYFFADRKKTLKLNGFDELMSPYLYEETDLCYRALKRGWKIYYEPKAKAYHAVSSSLNRLNEPFRKKVIGQRNRLIFIWKNIHDPKLLFFHRLWLKLRLLKQDKVTMEAFQEAKAMEGSICKLREKEKKEAVLTDQDLFSRYAAPPVVEVPTDLCESGS